MTIRMSLDTGTGLRLTKFVGLTNFEQLFKDRLFIDLSSMSGAVVNNGLWLVLYVGGCLGLGLLIASLADRVRYERVIKAIVFAPQAIAATAAAIIWLLVYAPQPNIGLLNGALGAAGVESDRLARADRDREPRHHRRRRLGGDGAGRGHPVGRDKRRPNRDRRGSDDRWRHASPEHSAGSSSRSSRSPSASSW